VAARERWQICPLCSKPAEAGYSVDLDAWIIGCEHCTNYGLSHGALAVLADNPEIRESLSEEVQEAIELVLLTELNVFKIAARRSAEALPELMVGT
jgi:hypothetical protein